MRSRPQVAPVWVVSRWTSASSSTQATRGSCARACACAAVIRTAKPRTACFQLAKTWPPWRRARSSACASTASFATRPSLKTTRYWPGTARSARSTVPEGTCPKAGSDAPELPWGPQETRDAARTIVATRPLRMGIPFFAAAERTAGGKSETSEGAPARPLATHACERSRKACRQIDNRLFIRVMPPPLGSRACSRCGRSEEVEAHSGQEGCLPAVGGDQAVGGAVGAVHEQAPLHLAR